MGWLKLVCASSSREARGAPTQYAPWPPCLLSLEMSCCRAPGGSQRLPDAVTPICRSLGPHEAGVPGSYPHCYPQTPQLASAGSPKGSTICQEALSLELLEEKEAVESQGTGLGSSLLGSALPDGPPTFLQDAKRRTHWVLMLPLTFLQREKNLEPLEPGRRVPQPPTYAENEAFAVEEPRVGPTCSCLLMSPSPH